MTLQNKIKDLLLTYLEETASVCTQCPHLETDHFIGGQREVCQFSGCVCDSMSFKNVVVGEGDAPILARYITETVKEYLTTNIDRLVDTDIHK